jgi:uncharacterized protein
MFLSKVNKKLYSKIEDYLNVAQRTLDLFGESMEYYLKNGVDNHFEIMVQKTHEVESDADDIKREIEQTLYEKSLLPDSREDIFHLIDALDNIPNKAESVLRRIYTQNIELPKEQDDKVWELTKLGIDTFKAVREMVTDALHKMGNTNDLARTIDSNESVGDSLEQKIIYEIFRSDIDGASRILLRDLVLNIGNILDLSEKISDIINIFTIKRQV